jgi:RsiW-degrading membrane proteinase PrsW (M82 family)
MGANFPVATEAPRRTYWWRVLLIAVALYLRGILVLFVTGNPILFPTVAMVGNFMIPVTYVAFFYEHRHLSALKLPTISLSFLYGGLLGVFSAAVLEPLFIQRLDFVTAFQVGLIEEFVKILGVLVLVRRREHSSELDGIILGAAAGMGFASLESMGYAFVTLLSSGGSFSLTVIVTLIRGVLSPLGHGAWTAILVGVLFRETRDGRFHVSRAVIGAYATVVILHGLWDGLPGVVGVFTGSGPDVFLSQSLVGMVGLVILIRRWREARSLQGLEAALADGDTVGSVGATSV